MSPPSRGRQTSNQTLGTNFPQTHAFNEHVEPEYFCSLTLRGAKDRGYLHITLMSVNPIEKGFRSHPLDWKSTLSKKKKNVESPRFYKNTTEGPTGPYPT